MSEVAPIEVRIDELPVDNKRGSLGMALAIVTEALLFVSFFFAYFFIGHAHKHFPAEPPKLTKAFVLLGILVASSFVLWVGEQFLKRGRDLIARALLLLTVLMGLGFLAIQSWEYWDHLKEVRPTSNAYGSLFYCITSFHGLHVLVGVLFLIFVFFLPKLEPRAESPYRPYHNAAMYWHFVDTVWVFIVFFLYALPHWTT